nr:hypothetical protein [Pseudodesulfovibrio sp.]
MNSYNITGVWKGRYFIADLIAHIEQTNSRISGHAEIHQPFGKVDIYHFSGTVRGNRVIAAHHKGSTFEGLVMNQDAIAGIVTTYKGNKLHISAKRVSMIPRVK